MAKFDTKIRPMGGVLTRRQLLKAGSLVVSASYAVPRLLIGTARAQTASGFDYYIAPGGSNSNPGTLSSPWAITAINSKQAVYAGKRVGFLPGTYDVSGLMTTDAQNGARTPVMNINGGTSNISRTYLGSCDSSGNYFPRTAIFNARGSNGYYGGGNTTTNAIMGCNNQVANAGYWTVDGFVFTGFSMWAFHVGTSPGGGAAIHDWTVQNCEFEGGNDQLNTISSGVNIAPFVLYTAEDGLITNNYFHDNLGWTDTEHFSCFYQWGYGTPTHNVVYSYNTLVNTGNIHSKEATQYNCEVAYNYIDMTNKTPSIAGSVNGNSGIFGFGSDGAALGTLSSFHHNVILHHGGGICLMNDTGANGWDTPAQIYNNTFVMVGNQISGLVVLGFFSQIAGYAPFDVYNNLVCDGGYALSGYGYWLTNVNALALCDYNVYGGGKIWCAVPSGQQSSGPALSSYSSLAAWGAAIGGLEANSRSTSINPFISNGVLAKQYQVQAGSPAYQAGRVGGVTNGAVCNVGAWDGIVSQIGCDFAVGEVLPDAPQIESVT